MPRPGLDAETQEGDYEIRRYRADDVERVLELDRVVWGRSRDPEWFQWKYERNPLVDEVPVFVAERGDEIVGARPFMAFRLRSGEDTRLALQPSDTMVHPDHRRRGLFTRMTERALDAYRSRHPGFYFNFPNDQARPGYEKLGWQRVRPAVTYYRVERPKAFLEGSSVGRLLGRAAGPPVRGYARARRAVSGGSSGTAVDVEGMDRVPTRRLVELYRRRVPDRFHADRTETFLEWRFASPAWRRRTYVAVDGGEDVAALVARTRALDDGGTVVTQLADVLPLEGGDRWRAAVDELIGAAIDDHPGSDLFSVVPGAVPRELLTSFGFLPDDRLPLSELTSRNSSLVTRPFDPDAPDPWSWNDRRLDDPDNWLSTFFERDTS